MSKPSIQLNEHLNMSDRTFILFSIGANLGDRKGTIEKAILLLAKDGLIAISKISSIYETEPVGHSQQPWFLNLVVSGYTNMGLAECLKFVKSIEKLLGRQERERWTEREIDIDILFFGDHIFKSDDLTVPHSRLQDRRFVLVPAVEISPDYVHPIFKKTLKLLLDECNDNSVVKKASII